MSKKMLYAKETPRIPIKYIDGETNDLLFEIGNRTWNDVGEMLSDNNVSELIKKQNFDKNPEVVRVLLVVDYYKK